MYFSINYLEKPTKEEILAVKRLAEISLDKLDGRELWILENYSESDEDD